VARGTSLGRGVAGNLFDELKRRKVFKVGAAEAHHLLVS
jgi:hypothetical protein